MKTPLLCLFPVLALVATNASAAIKTWDGSSSVSWGTTANWNPSILPIAADDLVFPAGAANKAMNNNLAAGLAFKTLRFEEGGYSIGGVAFRVTAVAGVVTAINATHTSGTVTLNVPVTLSTNTCSVTAFTGGTLTFGAASGIALGGQNLLLRGSGNIICTGAITGAGSGGTALTKDGTGTVTLSGNNSFTGTTSCTDGTVILNGSLSGGDTVAIGTAATLMGNNGIIAGPVTMAGRLSPGSISAGSKGLLTFTSDAAFPGSRRTCARSILTCQQ